MTSDEMIEKYIDLRKAIAKAESIYTYYVRKVDELHEQLNQLLDQIDYVDYLKAQIILEELKKGEKND